MVSIDRLVAVFPSGVVINVPDNATISPLDLTKGSKQQETVYLHLMQEDLDAEEYINTPDGQECISYALKQLVLSTDKKLLGAVETLKLAVFESNLEGIWTLSSTFMPPLLNVVSTPFLHDMLEELRSMIDPFENLLGHEVKTGAAYQKRTLATKLCLCETAKIKRYLLNLNTCGTHPYFLYETLSAFLDTIAQLYAPHGECLLLAYKHDDPATLFSELLTGLSSLLKPQTETLTNLKFEKRENCYVSSQLPQEVNDAEELFFIVQPQKGSSIEGLKLAAYSRLANVHQFALTGIPLMQLESAPFNNNFSREAVCYRINKDLEWDYGFSEGKLACSHQGTLQELQAFLYWR